MADIYESVFGASLPDASPSPLAQPKRPNPTDPDFSFVPEARGTSKGPDAPPPAQQYPASPEATGWDVLGGETPKPAPEVGPENAGRPQPKPAAPPERGPENAVPGPTTTDEFGRELPTSAEPMRNDGGAVAGALNRMHAEFHAAWNNDSLIQGFQAATESAIGDIIDKAKKTLGVTLEDPTHGGYYDEAVQRVVDRAKQQSWGQFFDPREPEGFFGGGRGFLNAVQAEQMKIFDERRRAIADQHQAGTPDNPDVASILDPDTPATMLGAKYSHAANVAASQAADRAPGLINAVAGFAGGMAGSFRDPVNDLALLAGGGIEPQFAKKFLPLARPAIQAAADITEEGVKQALINMGLTAIAAPEHQWANAQRGEDYGLSPALNDIGTAGLYGFIPGALIGGIKAIGRAYGPSSQPYIDEFIRQARGFIPDEPTTRAARAHMAAVHEWEESKGYPRGWTYSDVGKNRPPPEPEAPRAARAAEPEAPRGAAEGEDEGAPKQIPPPLWEGKPYVDPDAKGRPYPTPPVAPDSTRLRPPESSITPEQIEKAEADHAAASGVPAIPGMPPSEALRSYTEAVRHAEAPDVVGPPTPPLLAPPERGGSLPPDHTGAPPHEAGIADIAAGKPYTAGVNFPVRDLKTDAVAYQYKRGGDANGVTDRLRTAKAWNRMAAGNIVVHERLNGDRYVVDGHQRTGLARRIMDGDPSQNITIPGFLLKEADGWTPEEARAIAAKKNLGEGIGDPIDIARILRDAPQIWDDSLPVGRKDMREGVGIAKLSEDAFLMAANERVTTAQAALVGNMVADPALHAPLLQDFIDFKPKTVNEEKLLISDVLAAEERKVIQPDLLGDGGVREVRMTLRKEKMQVFGAAEKLLRNDKRVFSLLSNEADRIIEAGNVLTDTNESIADRAGQLAQGLLKLADRTGPISAALERGAREVADGKHPKTVAREFVKQIPDLLKQEGLKVPEVMSAPAYDVNTPEGRDLQAQDLDREFMASQPGLFGGPAAAPPKSLEAQRDTIHDHIKTGSTAYAFSAGGPVLWPEVEAIVVLPLAAHALFSRPMVIAPQSSIVIDIESREAMLSADGMRKTPLLSGDRVIIQRASMRVEILHIESAVFTDRLVAKFKLPIEGWRGE